MAKHSVILNMSDIDLDYQLTMSWQLNTTLSPSSLNTSGDNATLNDDELPDWLRFSDDNWMSIIVYSILCVIAASGNIAVLYTMLRSRTNSGIRLRVRLFIVHLCCADLIVACVMMPIEIGWHATSSWLAGDAMCRFLMFFRTFGLYVSSFILIAMSIDRFSAIRQPLCQSNTCAKRMIVAAWILAAVASAPQSVIFHEESHPQYPAFKQCVTFNVFKSHQYEVAYSVFNMCMLYLLPLVAIVVCYSCILVMIRRKLWESMHQSDANNQSGMRRSGKGKFGKASSKMLKMTIVIVLVFIGCWTPYFVIMSLYWINRSYAETIPPKIQRVLFIWAVSNSCVNPIVYGMFTDVFKRALARQIMKLKNLSNSMCCCRDQHEDSYSSTGVYRVTVRRQQLYVRHTGLQSLQQQQSQSLLGKARRVPQLQLNDRQLPTLTDSDRLSDHVVSEV